MGVDLGGGDGDGGDGDGDDDDDEDDEEEDDAIDRLCVLVCEAGMLFD